MTTDATIDDFTTTYSTRVTKDQIDHLGHMNVRFYAVAARAATNALVGSSASAGGAPARLVDMYTRHHREQLVDAELEVRSGLVDASPREIRLYHELVNPALGEIAATFVHRLLPGDAGLPSVAELHERAELERVEVPAHGRSRSIDLDVDPVVTSPPLETVRQRGLALRRVREIRPRECENGRFIPEMVPSLIWEGEPVEEMRRTQTADDWLVDGPNGERMGWATMETRVVINRLPEAGDRTQSFGAIVELGEKVTRMRNWAFDVDRGDLVVAFENVNLAFDTKSRRSMSIPERERRREKTRLHTDLDH